MFSSPLLALSPWISRGAITDVLSYQACWRATAEVLLRLLAMHRPLDSTNPNVIEQQIDMIVTALQRLGCLFPIASESSNSLQLTFVAYKIIRRHTCYEDPGRPSRISTAVCPTDILTILSPFRFSMLFLLSSLRWTAIIPSRY